MCELEKKNRHTHTQQSESGVQTGALTLTHTHSLARGFNGDARIRADQEFWPD